MVHYEVSVKSDGHESGAKPKKRLVRKTLSQAIAEEVVQRIGDGQYRLGEALPTERGLMEEFGVGRSSARESMQALASMGLIDIRPGRGARLIGIGSDQALSRELIARLLENHAIDDLYEFRIHVEQDIAGLAAARATADEVDALRDNLLRYRQTIDQGGTLFDLDVEFHQLVARSTHNVVFEQVLSGLTDLLNFARRQIHSVPGATAGALIEHQAVVDAVASGDQEAARVAMRLHIESALRAVREARRRDSRG